MLVEKLHQSNLLYGGSETCIRTARALPATHCDTYTNSDRWRQTILATHDTTGVTSWRLLNKTALILQLGEAFLLRCRHFYKARPPWLCCIFGISAHTEIFSTVLRSVNLRRACIFHCWHVSPDSRCDIITMMLMYVYCNYISKQDVQVAFECVLYQHCAHIFGCASVCIGWNGCGCGWNWCKNHMLLNSRKSRLLT